MRILYYKITDPSLARQLPLIWDTKAGTDLNGARLPSPIFLQWVIHPFAGAPNNKSRPTS